jgi:hypothetical protein
MTKARDLGNNARAVIRTISDGMLDSNMEFIDIVLAIHTGEIDKAVMLLKQVADRNQKASRALTLLLANQSLEAIELLVEPVKKGD